MKTIIVFAAALAAPLAHAHVTIEPGTASAGAYQKLTFRVGHGCEGSATHTLIVTLPEAIASAKPMPKAGWNIGLEGGTVSWKGGPLPDAWYDEFSLQVKLPSTPGKLAFKVTQLCEKGRMDWSELPGAAETKLKAPAPMLEVLPGAGPAHQH
ncbi:MAG: YcnI family protein [Pseudomonadota bacterium]